VVITPAGTITSVETVGGVVSDANIGAASNAASESGTTIFGNITVTGNVIAANITANSNIVANKITTTVGIFWSNGNAFISGSGGSGITYTANTAPPTTGNISGDKWYNTNNDVLYEYLDDGTTSYWIDIQSQTLAANTSTQETSIATINANIGAFQNYANTKIGTNTNGNLVVQTTTSSISTTTGALVVVGGVGVAGNVTADRFATTTGLFWANGTAFSSGLSSAQVNARIWAQNVFWG
jgi:hypothetical protein